jgi:nitroreductase
LVFCAETGWKSLLERFEQLLRENKWPGEKIRSMMETRREFLSAKKPKELLHWAQLQVYLALGNCLNAAHALGFASCPLGAFDAKGYARVLALPSNLVPTIVVPIGFPADQPKPKARFSREQILV